MPQPSNPEKEGQRIAKVIARSGACSRREAERLIEAGRVKVNGKPISSPALNVSDEDVIEIDGERVGQAGAAKLWRYYKPRGLVTTQYDPEGRPTVADNLPDFMPDHVITVGRLDIESEGLLLLTNDGELARIYMLPKTGWARTYRVRAWGTVTQKQLNSLRDGITLIDPRSEERISYGSIEAQLERADASNCWLTMTIFEGKNREIRNICRHLDLQVNRLIRTAFGPYKLEQLQPGEVKETRIFKP